MLVSSISTENLKIIKNKIIHIHGMPFAAWLHSRNQQQVFYPKIQAKAKNVTFGCDGMLERQRQANGNINNSCCTRERYR